MKHYRLSARVSSAKVEVLRPTLRELLGRSGSMAREGADLVIQAEMDGESARDLNRTLLSALRHVEKRTRLRAEWTAEGVSERFFDYVPKGTHPAAPMEPTHSRP